MTPEEVEAIEDEVDRILADYGLEWVATEVDEHLGDAWPALGPEAPEREVDRRRAARLVLVLNGVHRAARLLLATEVALERAQERHTDGQPWLVADRDQQRLLVDVPRDLARGERLVAVRGLGEATNALAKEVAGEFALPYEARDLTASAAHESSASVRDDEATAWLTLVEMRERLPYSDFDSAVEP
jgi:hypothetical protein